MAKKRTITVNRSGQGLGLELWAYGRKGPGNGFDPGLAEHLEIVQRTVSRAPEVMVKVTGGGRDAGTAGAHLKYISRNGVLGLNTDQGELVSGKNAHEFILEDWGLDMHVGGKNRKDGDRSKPKMVYNIVLSMPEGTPKEAVLSAAKTFARENFAFKHRYAMVLHDPSIDPKYEKTHKGNNPHVHLVVKAVSEEKQRLYVDREMLRAWREQFARHLRAIGVEANATPAYLRGKGKSNSNSNIYQHQKRIDDWETRKKSGLEAGEKPAASTLREKQVQAVIADIINGVKPDIEQKAKLSSIRESVEAEWVGVEKALRAAGKEQDADRVKSFINSFAPVKTDHELRKENFDLARLRDSIVPSKTTTAQKDKTLNSGKDLSR